MALSDPAPEGPDAVPGILSGIERAGNVGITARQIAASTRIPLPAVEAELLRLVSQGRITRVGRGLWMPRRFAESVEAASAFVGPEWYLKEFDRSYHIHTGTREGKIRFGSNVKLPVHRWWPYVQGFSAEFVEETLREFAAGKGTTVLDPFMGSGTVPVVSRLMGASSVGMELMPIAAFVARAKQNWDVDPEELLAAARSLAADRTRVPGLKPPFLKETRRQFGADVLDSLLRLKEGLWALPEGRVKTALQLCFAGILIDSSHLKRSPCLGYTRKEGLDAGTPYRLFLQAANGMAADLKWLQIRRENWGPEATMLEGNSKDLRLPRESVDLAITSPPYVNGLDYIMNYKVELAWMDFATSYAELSGLKREMVACDNVSKVLIRGHSPGGLVSSDPWIQDVLEGIRENLKSKSGYRRSDMAGVVEKYFDDLCPVIQNVHEALKPGGRFVVVNGDSLMAGTYVPGDLVFGRLAQGVGFEIEDLKVARRRRSGQRRNFLLRETILTLRKPA